MSKVKCEGCGVDLGLTDTELDTEKADIASTLGGVTVSAICPPCGELVQIAYMTAAACGIAVDGDFILQAIQKAHKMRQAAAVNPNEPARHRLIRALWAHQKERGVDYTRNPVAVDHDPFSDDSVTFERKVYDGKAVIEAEGLVVEYL